MKLILAILFFSSQVFAAYPPASVKGLEGTQMNGKFNLQFPANQVTNLGGISALVETGNGNLLKNPSFEAALIGQGWTITAQATASTSTNASDGKKSLRLVWTPAQTTPHVILSQLLTLSQNMVGESVELSMYVQPITLVNAGPVWVRLCYLVNGAVPVNDPYSGCLPNNIDISTMNTAGFTKLSLNAFGSVAGTTYTLRLEGGASTISPQPVVTVDYDRSYIGPNRNIGTWTPPNELSAQISNTGAVSSQTPNGTNWITGCAFTDTSLLTCTYTAGFFTSGPACTITGYTGSDPGTSAVSITGIAGSTSSISFRTLVGGVKTSMFFSLKCNKTGADYIQTAIRQDNADYGPRTFTPTLTGFGTPSSVSCTEARQGFENIIACKFTSGTSTAATATLALPYGRVATSLTPGNFVVGSWIISPQSATTDKQVIASAGSNLIYPTYNFGAADNFTPQTGSGLTASGGVISIYARVPIEGWQATQGAVVLPNSVYTGSTIVDTADGASFASGTYTPTWGTLVNITSLTIPIVWNWFRIGKNLNVWGTADIVPTSASTFTAANFSLPSIGISNFTNVGQCVGSNINYGSSFERNGVTHSVSGSNTIRAAFITGTYILGDTQFINFSCKLP